MEWHQWHEYGRNAIDAIAQATYNCDYFAAFTAGLISTITQAIAYLACLWPINKQTCFGNIVYNTLSFAYKCHPMTNKIYIGTENKKGKMCKEWRHTHTDMR